MAHRILRTNSPKEPSSAVSAGIEAIGIESSRKRGFAAISRATEFPALGRSSDVVSVNRRKARKVSRACDFCKQRKARCSGTVPCDKCVQQGRTCRYDALYSRGRPPAPKASAPPRVSVHPISQAGETAIPSPNLSPVTETPGAGRPRDVCESQVPPSRASPELGLAEIQGQVFDPTSGISFLHRAWKRLSQHDKSTMSNEFHASASVQPLMSAGDKVLPEISAADLDKPSLPPPGNMQMLLALYFDVCIATYRIVHRPSVEGWLEILEANVRSGKPAWQELGRSKAAIVFAALAIATAYHDRSRGFSSPGAEEASLAKSDELFSVAHEMTEAETGFPRLESAQARIIQVLYLLGTSRMNRAWYLFGDALQIISALGMHRKDAKKRQVATGPPDYIQLQFRIRTFWTAYILDKYLGVILGRPRHFHDDDIDQEYPDKIDDELMTPEGPTTQSDHSDDCDINSLIFHAKIAQIIGRISREVYSIKSISEPERAMAAHRLSEKLHDWRDSLPPHFIAIRPSMLIPAVRRQATVLKLAYSHAIMHANRLFLLGKLGTDSRTHVLECIEAARDVLILVDGMARDGPVLHAFWWTQYITFCALIVTYVWDTRRKRRGAFGNTSDDEHTRLMDLASRCQKHLANATAKNSPSRCYAVVLEEFRSKATAETSRLGRGRENFNRIPSQASTRQTPAYNVLGTSDTSYHMANPIHATATLADDANSLLPNYAGLFESCMLDDWQTTDWLDLDSSAFGLYDSNDTNMFWLPGNRG